MELLRKFGINKAKKIFDSASITYKFVRTEYARHAYEYMKKENLEE